MKQWQFKPVDQEKIQELSKQLNISPLVSQLLINRHITDPVQAHAFLFNSLKNLPDPFLLKDIKLAVERIIQAITKKEKIVIYGDYDVDGTTGTSLLLLFFREIGYPVEYYIPHRIQEGYSLNPKALTHLKEKGAHVIITVDNGISAYDDSLVAQKLGLDLIITDHHHVPDKKPIALAIINPHQSDCPFPAKEICGSGVAFYLMMALRSRLRELGHFKNQNERQREPQLKNYLDLVALATVADVVPLIGVNRIFVKQGITQMSQTKWPGLAALMKVSALSGKITASHLGFRLGPRVNACGRLYDASAGVKLLTSQSEQEAMPLAGELNRANQERQDVEAIILKEALEILEKDSGAKERMSHVLYSKNWHPGVIGIVASRIVERTCRPTILFGQDGTLLKGSARSYGGLHLVKALGECKDLLVKFGGHQAAAGLSLEETRFEEFAKNFDQVAKKHLTIEGCQARLHIDSELPHQQINLEILKELDLLEPYGEANPQPLFCLRHIEPQSLRVVGQKHLKFNIQFSHHQTEAIYFGKASLLNSLKGECDVAFSINKNDYQGRSSISLNVRDIKN